GAYRAPTTGGLGLGRLDDRGEPRLWQAKTDALGEEQFRLAGSAQSGAQAFAGEGSATLASLRSLCRGAEYPGPACADLWQILFCCLAAIQWSAALAGARAVLILFLLRQHNSKTTVGPSSPRARFRRSRIGV